MGNRGIWGNGDWGKGGFGEREWDWGIGGFEEKGDLGKGRNEKQNGINLD